MNLDQLSQTLQKAHQDRLQTDERLQHMINQRKELPVFNMRQEILAAVYDNPVTIIRGNTGCGKTTQVRNLTKGMYRLCYVRIECQEKSGGRAVVLRMESCKILFIVGGV